MEFLTASPGRPMNGRQTKHQNAVSRARLLLTLGESVVPIPSVDVNEILEKSRLLAEKASFLSNRLDEAETFFRQLPGKVECYVQQEDARLTFSRESEDGWRLIFSRGNAKTQVQKASVEIKAEAAHMLPLLYVAIQEAIASQIEDVEKALVCLIGCPSRADKNAPTE